VVNFSAMVCREKDKFQWHDDDRYEDFQNFLTVMEAGGLAP
jgi:predicted N-acyltransferase